MLGDVAFAQVPFASQGGNTFNAAVSETGSITSATAISSYIAFGAANETASALNAQSVIATFVATNSETASGAAVFDTINNTFNVALVDGASGVDTISAQVNFASIVSEAAAAIDALLSQANFVATVAEAASANAAHQGGLLLLVFISETASAVDASTKNVIFSGAVQEFASGLDNLSVVKTLNANVTGVQLVVRVGNILIWSQVNDNQDPNWQNVNDTQSTVWVVISNPSTPGWTVLPS
jgi:hypothetical protein